MNPTDNVAPLPYELHTDRELEFMLKRGKPLAHFSDAYPSERDEEIVPELAFAPHVLDGRFVKREFVEPLSGPPPPGHLHVRGIRHIFYAKSAEAMGIEPTRPALPGLGNKRFGAMRDVKCDWRVNFRGMWGHARLRRDTSMSEVPGSGLSVVGR